MTTALKLLCKPSVSDFNHSLERNESGRHHKYIGIVVLLDKLSDFNRPTETCADALVLVEGHLHSVTGAAERDSEVYLSVLQGCSKLVKGP